MSWAAQCLATVWFRRVWDGPWEKETETTLCGVDRKGVGRTGEAPDGSVLCSFIKRVLWVVWRRIRWGRWIEGATSVTILDPWDRVQRSTSPILVVNFSSASPLSYQRCQMALLPSRYFCVRHRSGQQWAALESKFTQLLLVATVVSNMLAFCIISPSDRPVQSKNDLWAKIAESAQRAAVSVLEARPICDERHYSSAMTPALTCGADMSLDTYNKRPLRNTTQVAVILQRSSRLEASGLYERECII